MIYWGINALNHGHSVAVFKNAELVENYVGLEDELSSSTICNLLHHGAPDKIFWYEKPWVKKARQLYAGQYRRAFDLSVLPKVYMNSIQVQYAPITYTPHHASHAAAGYYTSPFDRCAVVVIDAIGEFECATIWNCAHGEMKKVWSRSYPNSLGLFYSAFTDLLGMTPIRDEYLLQQMAEKGDPYRYKHIILQYMSGLLQAGKNMHKGIVDWPFDIRSEQDKYDIAAAVQARFESQIDSIMLKAQVLTGAESLVYMGGCAMNSRANRLFEKNWKGIWSLPNPGDPSSSIGAVLYHTKDRIRWEGALANHITIKYNN
jgi:carbamoyltransferase